MGAVQRVRSWLRDVAQGALTPAWSAPNRRPRAYFVYAKSKTAGVEGKLSYPVVDAVVLADRNGPVQYYQIGRLDEPALVPSDSLPYRVTVGDVLWALLSLDREAVTQFQFIKLVHRGLERRFLPWRVRWLWDVRNLLLARAIAARMRQIAAAHDVAYVSDFYSAVMLGVTLAFRRLGKPVWDIQHGRIGPAHQTYNAPVFAIDCGFRPTGLVVWDSRVGAYVDEALHVPWVTTDFAHLRLTRRAGLKPARAILYTLQVDTPIPPAVVALIREDGSFQWRFRLHPGGRNPERDYRPLLELPHVSLSAPRVPIEDDLLDSVAHVTVNSSVVSEAAVLGIRSVLLDPAAKRDFAHEIESGMAELARPEDLGAVLRAMLQTSGAA